MKPPIKEFSDDLDKLIRNGSCVDAFDLPLDYIENLNVVVVCSTYINNPESEHDGLHFILKTRSDNDRADFFCRITSGDGGVIIARSVFTTQINELLIKSDEGWSYF